MSVKSVLGWAIFGVASLALAYVLFSPPTVLPAEARVLEPAPSATGLSASINNLWLTVATILVVLMQPGFAFLESGLIREGNVINVLFKNTIDFCLNGIFFFYIGYSLMWNGSSSLDQFHGSPWPGWLPTTYAPYGLSAPIHFLFQMVFATTAATICSGLVAGRIQVPAYFIATVVISSLIYPVAGFWVWCADSAGMVGFLARLGYHDLAGSSVVHVVGGFAGLAGAMVLGPRLGRYPGDPHLGELRKTHAGKIPGLSRFGQGIHKPHNFTSATLGTFLLWVGWFGFNGGSVLAFADGHEKTVGLVLINTMLSACGGGITGSLAPFIYNWLHALQSKQSTAAQDLRTKPYYSYDGTLNGIIGGLVAITAGCDLAQPLFAVVVGMAAGLLVHISTYALNHLPPGWRIDDPVGAFPVHGVCGIFGVLVCAYFSEKVSFGIQAFGCALLALWSFGVSFLVFWSLHRLKSLRVSPEAEIQGLDAMYHGQSAYTIHSPSENPSTQNHP